LVVLPEEPELPELPELELPEVSELLPELPPGLSAPPVAVPLPETPK
jgi:hypothetical protein